MKVLNSKFLRLITLLGIFFVNFYAYGQTEGLVDAIKEAADKSRVALLTNIITEIKVPVLNIQEVKLPQISAPNKLSEIKLPEISTPVKLLDIKPSETIMPKIEAVSMLTPGINIPEVKMPVLKFPEVNISISNIKSQELLPKAINKQKGFVKNIVDRVNEQEKIILNNLNKAIVSVKSGIKNRFTAIANIFVAAKNSGLAIVNGGCSVVKGGCNSIKNGVYNFGKGSCNIVKGGCNKVKNGIYNIGKGGYNIVKGGFNAVGNGCAKVKNYSINTVKNGCNSIKNGYVFVADKVSKNKKGIAIGLVSVVAVIAVIYAASSAIDYYKNYYVNIFNRIKKDLKSQNFRSAEKALKELKNNKNFCMLILLELCTLDLKKCGNGILECLNKVCDGNDHSKEVKDFAFVIRTKIEKKLGRDDAQKMSGDDDSVLKNFCLDIERQINSTNCDSEIVETLFQRINCDGNSRAHVLRLIIKIAGKKKDAEIIKKLFQQASYIDEENLKLILKFAVDIINLDLVKMALKNGAPVGKDLLDSIARMRQEDSREALLKIKEKLELVKKCCALKCMLKEECQICSEKLFVNGKSVYDLDCGHKYHKDCIDSWYKDGEGVNRDKCPECRKVLNFNKAKIEKSFDEAKLKTGLKSLLNKDQELFFEREAIERITKSEIDYDFVEIMV